MKKEGYVVKIISKESFSYLDVIDVSETSCSTGLMNSTSDKGVHLHDCSTCSGCTHIFNNKDRHESSSRYNVIRVLNRGKKDVKIGEKIEYSVSGWVLPLQVFLFLCLPVLVFACSFSLLSLKFGEPLSIFVSLASLVLTATICSFISRVFLYDAFMPKVSTLIKN